MAVFQLRLQRELLDPCGEQLLALVQVSPTSHSAAGNTKRHKELFIALLNRVSHGQFDISIAELKSTSSHQSDGTRDQVLPKKKRTWSLKELVGIDAKYNETTKEESPEFSLDFDTKVFTWSAVNVEEKRKFLSTLINLSARHSQKHRIGLSNLSPDIIIVDEDADEATLASKKDSTTSWPIFGDKASDSYEAISGKEASDLLALMSKCDHAVTNADVFMDDLGRQLSILDGANIHSIMASEENIDKLMGMLTKAIDHTEEVEQRLNQYDEQLEHIRDSMDKMEGKTLSIETVNGNNKRLLECLEGVFRQLDIPYAHQAALAEADFSSSRKLRECVQAARSLEKALNSDIDPQLVKMTAVQNQMKRCEKLRDKFSKSISRHLQNIFVDHGNKTQNQLESTGSSGGQLKLTRRKHIHKGLMKYAELVHWTKIMDRKGFEQLQGTYRENLCKLYDNDIRKFFEMARFRISGNRTLQPVAGSSSDLSGKKDKGKVIQSGLLGNDTDSIHSDMSTSERERFDDILETVLIELEDICMDEQYFSINFFQMEQIDAANPDPKKDKKVMEEARNMMAEIFPSLESELVAFLSFYERADSFFTMHALVRLSKHVLSTQDTGSFLAISFGTVLVQIKRNFDKFMQLQLTSIQEAKTPRRAKCGILAFIAKFEVFVRTTEGIFRGSERRSDLEKWYATLVLEMCTAIVRVSREHGKTPAEVIKMENYHHLHALLSQMKIGALDPQRKDIKTRYSEALRNYVTQYFGRPLEKLNVFFDGIQQLVSAGIKESEISYQLDYSKQELRKVIAAYPGKEVKKGLESLYRKVERHLCEEESLVQVVWRAMQEEFITQYKNIEDLVQRCYPGAQIALDFTINEVLDFFSDIARSH